MTHIGRIREQEEAKISIIRPDNKHKTQQIP